MYESALISWSTISKSLYLSVSLCEPCGLLLKVIHATGQTGSNLASCYALVLSVFHLPTLFVPLFVCSYVCHSQYVSFPKVRYLQ